MRFIPEHPNDSFLGQRQVWNAITHTFPQDEGIAFYRYPMFSNASEAWSEPDFLVVHRELGIWILECKGCQIGQIERIEGFAWQMRRWYKKVMAPVNQAQAQHFQVRQLLRRVPELQNLKVPVQFRVVLPFVTTADWAEEGHDKNPSAQGVVWLKEDLSASVLRGHMLKPSNGSMRAFKDDANWELLLGAFSSQRSKVRASESGVERNDYDRTKFRVEKRLPILDERQSRIAMEVPEGPQRIRGLAGAGKTVLFARRIALMHASNPNWEIAFIYWSRSLTQLIEELVRLEYEMLTGNEPNWDKLHIWHAWGSADKTGLYRELASRWNRRFLSLKAIRALPTQGEEPFETACRILEEQTADAPPLFDAVIIDEGQDLPPPFYRLCYRALKPPKRLYWAYDEAQGVDTLMVPNAAEIFGRDAQGRPTVDLSGMYPSGVQKAHNINCCYRTPRKILVAAHALNMGLLRNGGPIQGVSSKEDWTALGYTVAQGDFGPSSVKAGVQVVLERPDTTSGHPIDEPGLDIPHQSDVLVVHTTINEDEDAAYVAKSIERDLEAGLRAEDIAVVCLEPHWALLQKVKDLLQVHGHDVLILDENNKDRFRLPGHVTLSGIRRAKGNEAFKVYALNLHMAGTEYVESIEEELKKRNHVLVALTRTKLWCVALGRQGEIMQELSEVVAQDGRLRFKAFNQASLKRSTSDTDGQQSLL